MTATAPVPILQVRDATKRYGGVMAVQDISFDVYSGEILGLIGPNGAGKTTLINLITGTAKPTRGTITFEGNSLAGRRPHAIGRGGIARTFQVVRPFANLTVRENLEMGAYLKRNKREINEDMERAFTLFPRLKEREKQVGGTLSGGEQQMLAVGRALMSRPKLLLLDEPSMGLAPMLIQQIFDIIVEINQQGTTVLLVEQNAQQALSRAHRAYVLETGRIVTSGTGAELLRDPSVKDAYLGVA
jgi:branched-chain amino acid transport system ATP-binding protein